MRAGQRVVDLGCWPGGWLQEAARAVGPRGRVVGVDLAAVEPPLEEPNVVSLVGDLADPSICEQVRTMLDGAADVLLCDAAPKLTGIRDVDRANEEHLLLGVEVLIPRLLKPGGDLLVKLLEAPEVAAIDRRIRARFARAKTVKVAATRKGSRERYLLARDFQGAQASPE